MYTNIDGVMSSRLELEDYLKEVKPSIVCLAETKLNEAIKLDLDNSYNLWRKDRVGKGGGGVMIMTKKEMHVNQVLYGEGKAEVISVRVENNKKEMSVIAAYVPPRTNAWTKEDHDQMIEDTLYSLSQVI